MESFAKVWITIFLISFIYSCSPSARNSELGSETASDTKVSQPASAESQGDANSAVSSTAAKENGSDTTRKFIRTAELRFRVTDVIKTTYSIEDITERNDGFVTESNIASDNNYDEEKIISKDSILIISRFTITGHLTIRVPNIKLDTTLKQIAPLIEFLDYRIIRANDVALSLLANRLQYKRNNDLSATIGKSADNSQRTKDVTFAAGTMQNMLEQRDQATINNQALMDQINFSTIQIDLYQRNSVKYRKEINQKNENAYKPGFFSRLLEAFSDGIGFLKEFVIVLANIWWVIIIIILLVYFYRKRKKHQP